MPESRGRLCCGCWAPAPGSLSPATHPRARPRLNSLATGWRWLSLGREGFCQLLVKSQHYSCQHWAVWDCMHRNHVPGFCQTAWGRAAGRGGSLSRALLWPTRIPALLSLCCCQLRDSHPGGTGGRGDLWRCAFGCRNHCSAEVLLLLHPLVSKSLILAPLRATTPGKAVTAESSYQMDNWSQFGSQDTPRPLGFEELSITGGPLTTGRVSMWSHIPQQSWSTCPCGERDPQGLPAFQEWLKQNRKAYEQMWLLHHFCQGSPPQASAVGRGLTRAAVPGIRT